jgi:eukaryotic-like serine/threonine-protein kinase
MAQGKLEQAIFEYRNALRIKPDLFEAHVNLGLVVLDQGKLDEAVEQFRAALRLRPDLADLHLNLGAVLHSQRKLDEANDEFRTALRLEPGFWKAHCNLGNLLKDQGKPDEAIAEYRESLRLKPDSAEVHANLGIAFRDRGEYPVAIAELSKARDLANKTNARLAQQIERQLAETDQLASLAARLTAILAGKVKPVDTTEMLGLAQLCYMKQLHGASARFWAEALQSQPKLAEDMQVQHRYNAACAAALAGCGQGKDDPPLDDATKARWRKQAIAWLKADLAAWTKIQESAQPQAKSPIAKTLQHWKADPDLAGLRDPGSLDKLPKDEQDACRALWKEVDALLARSGESP